MTARYREIEQQQKILKSEFEHLQERVKTAMLVQNIPETIIFLILFPDTGRKISIKVLTKLTELSTVV